MNIIELTGLALARLRSARMRAALTMLGIVIGVGSVVALVSVAQGATKGITSRIEGLGTNVLTVNAGASFSGGVRGAAGSATTLTLKDAVALASVDGVEAVAPQVSTSAVVEAGTKNTTTTILGTTSAYATVRTYSVWAGAFLTDAMVENGLRVAVLGATTADDLGLDSSSIGSEISIGGLPFQVVGILQAKGGTGIESPDDQVLVPLTAAQKYFVGGGGTVRSIGISVASTASLTATQALVTTTLEQRHGIAADASDDFTVQSATQLLSTATSVSTLLAVLLGGIASISLVVGGIGIMNIMLVSVRERTREIGIRKAIGAKSRDILLQFLIEALVLSVLGGAIGIAGGLVADWAIGELAGWGFSLSPVTLGIAIAFSALVGIVFGVWPARQAARLDPIAALRYE